MAVARTRKIGRLGEIYFERLCVDAGLTATRPEHDENGWDYLVEFPQNRIPNVLLDAQPSPLKCLCQIKSTDRFDRMSLPMKVSNFEHLARNPMPTFIVVLEFDGDSEPKRAFLCHFGAERVGQTLRRIREIEAGGDKSLHNHYMNLNVSLEEQFEITSKDVIAQKIRANVGIDFPKYLSTKSEWIRLIGYDDSPFTFSLKSGVLAAELVDAMLGLRDLEIEGATISSSRFGISLVQQELMGGTLRITPSDTKVCELRWSSAKAGKYGRLRMQIVAPPIPDLPPELLKLRIYNDVLEFIVQGNEVHFSAKIESDKPYSIQLLNECLDFIVSSGRSALNVSFLLEGKQFASGKGLQVTQGIAYESLAMRVKCIDGFTKKVDWSSPILMTCDQIFDQDQEFALVQACGLPKSVRSVSYTFTKKVENLLVPAPTMFASYVALKTGDSHLVAFCLWQVKCKVSGDKVTIVFKGDPAVWGVYQFGTEQDETFKALYAQFMEYCREVAAEKVGGSLMHRNPGFETHTSKSECAELTDG